MIGKDAGKKASKKAGKKAGKKTPNARQKQGTVSELTTKAYTKHV